jgi:putative ATP-grasp target RiPP
MRGSADDDELDFPLSSIQIRARRAVGPTSEDVSDPAACPLALRVLSPAPDHAVPAFVYDPQRQIAVDPHGRPLAPSLAKDWTTVEGTHTDGDGGDNEMWGWEETR